MASQAIRVTKRDLLELLKNYKDKDFVGVIASAQDGQENPCHEILIFYKEVKGLF